MFNAPGKTSITGRALIETHTLDNAPQISPLHHPCYGTHPSRSASIDTQNFSGLLIPTASLKKTYKHSASGILLAHGLRQKNEVELWCTGNPKK